MEVLPAAAASITLTPVTLTRLPTSTRGDWPSGSSATIVRVPWTMVRRSRPLLATRSVRKPSTWASLASQPSSRMSSSVIGAACGGGCEPTLVSAAERSTGLKAPGSAKPVARTTSPMANAPRACVATSTPPVSSLSHVGPVGLVSSTTPCTADGSSPRVEGVNCSSSAIVVDRRQLRRLDDVQVVHARQPQRDAEHLAAEVEARGGHAPRRDARVQQARRQRRLAGNGHLDPLEVQAEADVGAGVAALDGVDDAGDLHPLAVVGAGEESRPDRSASAPAAAPGQSP